MQKQPFDFLEKRSAQDISALLLRESDRVCAAVLSRLPKVLAVKTLADFSASRQQDLLTLMKSSAAIDPELLQGIADDLRSRLSRLPAKAAPAGDDAPKPVVFPRLTSAPATPAKPVPATPAEARGACAPSPAAGSPGRTENARKPSVSSRMPEARPASAPAQGAPSTVTGRFAAVLAAAKKTEEKAPPPPPSGKKISYGGPAIAAAILRLAGKNVRRNLKKEDPELFRQLVRYMYTFDDLVEVDDGGLQTLLAEMDTRVLAFALKAAAPRLRERFLRNLSPRRAALVDSELESIQRVRLSDIETAQKAVLDEALALQEHGRILIDHDAEVV